MNEVKKQIDEAFKLISCIPVSGENVEIMAAAKAKLRTVYAELSKRHADEQEDAENGR